MKIEVTIPSIDRLCDILEKGITINNQSTSPLLEDVKAARAALKTGDEQPTAAEEETPKPQPKKKTTKKKVETEPVEETEPAVTVEDVTALGKQFVAKNSGTELRALLDKEIKGETISKCDPAKYPALLALLQEALK